MVKLVSGLLLAIAALAAAAEPLSVEQFFQRPLYSRLKLSPDGLRVGAIVRGPKRDMLAIVDVDTRKAKPITNFADADVLNFYWVDDQRLVLNVGDAHEAAWNAEYYGWYIVNADGSELEEVTRQHKDLLTNPRAVKHLPWCRGVEALRAVTRCWVDRKGVARVAHSSEDGRERISYRSDPNERWRILEDAERGKLSFSPLGIDRDDTLYVRAYEKGSDKLAIYRYDFAKNRIGERVARHLDANMDDVILSDSGRLLGFTYEGEHSSVIWVDETMARLQRMANRALSTTSNAVDVAFENPKRALITTHSDVAPPTFYLLDTEKLTMMKFASSRPWINPAEMSERKFVIYKARDGLDIPAYLTVPKASSGKNLPLVVEIHGGPWINKQTTDFNLNAEFFASRGYAVLQPDFRGTLGYGKHHFEASFGEWGYSMQDDITDGVEWAIAQGIADKNRVCLFGASYGGYAAIWGLMKTPDLYRCGIALAAPTHLKYMFSFNRWDWGRSVWTDYDGRRLIGDPDRDEEKFNRVSPVEQAARLKSPLLLAYGDGDQRVPIKNGTALRAALDKYSKKYEWVVYADEGHGLNDDKNRFDFWRRVDAFLKKNLADPASQQ